MPLVFEDWYREEHPRLLSLLVAATGDVDVAVESTDEDQITSDLEIVANHQTNYG